MYIFGHTLLVETLTSILSPFLMSLRTVTVTAVIPLLSVFVSARDAFAGSKSTFAGQSTALKRILTPDLGVPDASVR